MTSKIDFTLDILTIIFAIAAAGLWLWSAQIKTPDDLGVIKLPQIIIGGKPGNIIWNMDWIKPQGQLLDNDIVIAKDFPQKLGNLAYSLKVQSKISGWAASCAAISALAQATVFILKLIIK